MNKTALYLLIIVPGVVGFVIFGHFALQDWSQRQQTYIEYKQISATSSDITILFKANASQMIQRINLFADGTWALLSAIFTAIGLSSFLVSN